MKMKNINKIFGSTSKLVALFLLTAFLSWGQVTLYSEDFSTNDGKGKQVSSINMSGVTNWTIDAPGNLGGYFKVNAGKFEAFDTKASQTSPLNWISSTINISAYTASISIDLLKGNGASTAGVQAYYSLDNGVTWISIGSIIGNGSIASSSGATLSGSTLKVSGLIGNSLIIKVSHWGANYSPTYYHDNVKVTGVVNCAQPTSSASATGNTISSASKTTLDVNWKNGIGDKVLVIMAPQTTGSNPATYPAVTVPSSGTAYSLGGAIGSYTVVYNGTGTLANVTGLTLDTKYRFYVFPYNTTGNCFKTDNPYTFDATTLAECQTPLNQASYLNVTNKTKTDISLNWTAGSGDKVIVVARLATATRVVPTFGANYLSATNLFNTSPATTGLGNIVVYNGNGSNVTVSGLTVSTNYVFDVYTYNSADYCYNKTINTTNGNTVSTSTKSDVYLSNVWNNQIVEDCGGIFADGGGITGNIPSGTGTETVTFKTQSATEGVCLTFRQTDWLVGGSNLTFYDGSALIYKATDQWDQDNTSYPSFKGPGMVCSSPGTNLKVEFKKSSTTAGFIADISCYDAPQNCSVTIKSPRTIVNDKITICEGESVDLTADGYMGAALINNTFTGSTLGQDWSSVIDPRWDAPCGPGLEGVHFWTRTENSPRNLSSKKLDVTKGGSLSFDFRMAVQADSGEPNSKDCEGPDEIQEGVYVEYSTDGTTWKRLHYFFPPKSVSEPTSKPSDSPTTTWKRYYYRVPDDAISSSTTFRWQQYKSTAAINDVWGLDRINITATANFKTVWQNVTDNLKIAESNTNENPFSVQVKPTKTTVYKVSLINTQTNLEVCSKLITVEISTFNATVVNETSCGTGNGSVTFTNPLPATGNEYSINNGLTWQASNIFSNLQGGTYSVVLKSPTCNGTKKLIVVSAAGGPQIVQVSDIVLCPGDVLSPSLSPIILNKVNPSPGTIDATVTADWINDNTSFGLSSSGSNTIPTLTAVNTSTAPLSSTIKVVPKKNGCIGPEMIFKITINAKDDPSFFIADFCPGIGSGAAVAATSVAKTGGLFSLTNPPSSVSISTTTGLISGATANTILKAKYNTSNSNLNCQSSKEIDVKVNIDDPYFEYNTYCAKDLVTFWGGATNITKTGGTFSLVSPPSGVTIDAVTGSIRGGVGGTTYSVNYITVSGACQATKTVTVTPRSMDLIERADVNICYTPNQATIPQPEIKVNGVVVTAGTGTYDFANTVPIGVTIDNSTGLISIDPANPIVGNEVLEVLYSSNGTVATCSSYKIYKINLVKIPVITTQPIDVSKCDDLPVEFSVVATNAATYQWQESIDNGTTFTDVANAGVFSGATTIKLSITKNTGLDGHKYRVVIKEAINSCSVTSNVVLLTVQICCPTITLPSSGQKACKDGTPNLFSVTTTETVTRGVKFVYFTSAQTGTNMYTGGTALGDASITSGVASYTPTALGNSGSLPNLGGDYYVYAILANPAYTSCRDFKEIKVTVDAPPVVTVNSPNVCVNGSATITATVVPSGSYNYSWTVPTGFTNPGNVASFTANKAGMYSVNVTNKSLICNTDFDDVNLSIYNNYTLVNQSSVPCWKTTATDGKIEFWGKDYLGVPSYSGNQFVELNATQVASLYQDFTALPNSTVDISFAHRGRNGVDVMQVEIGPVGGPYVNLGTFSDGNTSWGYRTVNYTFPSTVPTNYRLQFTAVSTSGGSASMGNFLDAISIVIKGCTIAQASGTLTVGNPVVNVIDPAPICNGSTVDLANSITTGTSSGLTYAYSIDNNGTAIPTSNGTANAIKLGSTYYIKGTSSGGCSTIKSVLVTVNPTPIVTVPTTIDVCNGGAVSTTAFTSTPTGGTYTWTNSNTAIGLVALGTGNITGFNATNTTSAAISSTITVTPTVNGCLGTANSYTINVKPTPIVTVPTTIDVCNGGALATTAFTSTPTGGTYTWTNSNTAIGLVALGTGNITGFNATNTGSAAISSIITVTPTVNSCIGTPNTYTITINPTPTITGPAIICIGNTYALTSNSSSSGSTSWVSDSPSSISVNGSTGLITGISEGKSTITYTDNIGCKNTISISVPNPKITGNLKLCEGNQVNLIGSGIKSPTNPWTSGTIQIATINDLGTVTGVKMGSSQITYMDENGCKTSKNIIVTPSPTTNFISDINSGCLPLQITFTNNSLPKSDSVVWDFGDGNIISLQKLNSEVKHTFTKSGCFDISLVSYSNGCSNKLTNTKMICTLPKAEASFDVNKSEGTTVDPIILFTNTSKNASLYEWSFGDNTGSELEDIIHEYAFEKGQYLVTLVAKNSQGCTDTTERVIKIIEELVFYVPNSFTPDEDNLNKVFKPVFTSGYDPFNFTMFIFNRWGELVFETHDSEKGWNGNYGMDGILCQDGLYIWKIHYKELNKDKEKIVTGNVILIK